MLKSGYFPVFLGEANHQHFGREHIRQSTAFARSFTSTGGDATAATGGVSAVS